jgi:hypothetical protein
VARISLLDELGQETWLFVEDQCGDQDTTADSVFPLWRGVAEGRIGAGGVALESGC